MKIRFDSNLVVLSFLLVSRCTGMSDIFIVRVIEIKKKTFSRRYARYILQF